MAQKTKKSDSAKGAKIRGTCSLEKKGKAVVLSCTNAEAARKVLSAAATQPVSDAFVRRLAKQAMVSWRKKSKGEKRPVLSEAEAKALWQKARKDVAAHLGAEQTGKEQVRTRERFMNELEQAIGIGVYRGRGGQGPTTDLFGPAEFEGAIKPIGGARFQFGQGPTTDLFGPAEFEGAIKPGRRISDFDELPTRRRLEDEDDDLPTLRRLDEIEEARTLPRIPPFGPVKGLPRIPHPDDVKPRDRESKIRRSQGRGSARR